MGRHTTYTASTTTELVWFIASAVIIATLFIFAYAGYMNSTASADDVDRMIVTLDKVDWQKCSIESPQKNLAGMQQENRRITMYVLKRAQEAANACTADANTKMSIPVTKEDAPQTSDQKQAAP